MCYNRLNAEPLKIEYVLNEDGDDFIVSFLWNDKRYYLCDFIRTHNNPWGNLDVPEYIHGYEADNYWSPLFIELIADEAVNVYEVIE